MAEQRPQPTLRHRRGAGRRIFWILLAVIALLAAWGTGPGFARQREHRGHSGDRDRLAAQIELLIDQLGLEGDGRDRVIRAAERAADELAVIEVEAGRLRDSFPGILVSSPASAADLAGLRAEARDLSERSIASALDLLEVVLKETTPEQRRQLAEGWERFR